MNIYEDYGIYNNCIVNIHQWFWVYQVED